MKTGIATLTIMLSITGSFIVGAALAFNEPARLYWFLFISELFLVCSAFLTAWSAGDALSRLTKLEHCGLVVVKVVTLLIISVLLFISGDWVHLKPQMEDSIQQLVGMEGLYAQASHDGMQLFMFACLMVAIVKLILAYIQGVILGSGGDSLSQKELDNGVRRNGIPSLGDKPYESKEYDHQ